MTNARIQDIRQRMMMVMGSLATQADNLPLDVVVHDETHVDGVRRQSITYTSEPGAQRPDVTAYLLLPDKPLPARPAMICPHQTTAVGKEEPAGVSGKPDLHYAFELAARGFVALAPDALTFGDLVSADPCPTGYVSGTMKSIQNHRRGIELLAARDDVDANRIGAIGHSLGGHNSLFLAAFDQRIKAVVTSCGFDTWQTYARQFDSLKAWSQRRYMPRVADVYGCDPDQMPFTFEEVLEAISPRPLFINAPLHDANFQPDGVAACVDHVRPTYEAAGAAASLEVCCPDAEHTFPVDVREQAYAFLTRVLAG